jgi:antitoxin component of RelBE/YafQ-DinJ toxin-antitoxin module
MATIEVELNEKVAERLQAVAESIGMTPEEFLRMSVEEKLAQFDEDFITAKEYVFSKNAELYKRLA